MTRKLDDALIDSIVADCDGDIRSALEALLIINELLEEEIRRLNLADWNEDGATPNVTRVIH